MQSSSLATPKIRPGALWPSWLGGRRGLILGAIVMTAGAAALGWPWLVAAGLAPLLLSLAPCLAMCGLGLCMRGMSGSSCSKPPAPATTNPPWLKKEPTDD